MCYNRKNAFGRELVAHFSLDFNNVIGKIKPMHGVGQPPIMMGYTGYMHYLKDANIPYSRLHDVGGPFGGNVFVDIPNLFRNFDADENDPASYDFAFTDLLINSLYENDCEPIFRLGVTIENYPHVKRYRIYPPADYAKWARICEHVIRHYTEGWADGYTYPIRYWEIWNEPDGHETPELSETWAGTPEQFFELYDVAAKHLKACFGDKIKVGGYAAACGFSHILTDYEKYGIKSDVVQSPALLKLASTPRFAASLQFFFDFMEHIKVSGAPLDFFSWHSYSTVDNLVIISEFIHRKLREYGYGHVETQLNEWNNAGDATLRGKSVACARGTAVLCAMQNTEEALLCYYDARIGHSSYAGLFDPVTRKPFCLYKSFVAFGEMYAMGHQVACEWDDRKMYAVAATDGEKKAVLIANTSGYDRAVTTNLGRDMKVYLIDEEHLYEATDLDPASFTVKGNQVVFIKSAEEETA